MAKLKNCKTCSKEISTSAKICPHCGEKLRMGFLGKLLVTVCIVISMGVIGSALSSIKSADEIKKEAASKVEIETMIKGLQDGGLLVKYNIENNEVWVNLSKWLNIDIESKKSVANMFSSYFDMMDSTRRVTIYDNMSGKELASFSSLGGLKVY